MNPKSVVIVDRIACRTRSRIPVGILTELGWNPDCKWQPRRPSRRVLFVRRTHVAPPPYGVIYPRVLGAHKGCARPLKALCVLRDSVVTVYFASLRSCAGMMQAPAQS